MLDRPDFSANNKSAVDWDVLVRRNYWTPGAYFPPTGASKRSTRLDHYHDLFEGMDQTGHRVRTNFYRRASIFIGDLLASFPPMVTGLEEEAERMVNEQLANAAYYIGLHQTQFGTAVLRPLVDIDGMPIIEAVDPRWWFPSDDPDTDMIVSFSEDYGDGPTRINVQFIAPDGIDSVTWRFDGHELGRRIIGEQYMGIGQRGVFPLPRPPSVFGNWGVSMYEDMEPLVMELDRRASAVSTTLDRHGDPLLVFRKMQIDGILPPTDNQDEYVIRAERLYLDEARTHGTLSLPPEFEGAEYLVWDAQLQATFSHQKQVEDHLFAATGIPAALYAADRSALASGTALKRVFAPTYAMLHSLQTRALPRLRQIIDVLGELGGFDTSAVQLEWGNPLDHLDTQTVLQTSDEDAAEDAVEDREVSDDESD